MAHPGTGDPSAHPDSVGVGQTHLPAVVRRRRQAQRVRKRPTVLLGGGDGLDPGLLWLGTLFGWDKPIIEWGLTPFVLGDLTKLALAAAVLPLAWKQLGRPKPAD